MPYWTMSRARQAKQETLIPLPLPTTLLLLQTQAGPVQPLELRPSPPLRVSFLGDRQARGHQGSFLEVRDHSPLVLEHQGNTPDLLQRLVGSHQVLGYLDNIHLDQGLQGSSPLALELLGSSQGSTHLKELQDSYLEPPFHTQLDRFIQAPELPLGLILMCLSQAVSQEEGMGCTDRVAQVPSPLQPVQALSLDSLVERFLRSPLDHGDHLAAEVSLRPLAPLLQHPWGHMVGLPLLEACCPDIIHHIFESNEINFSVGQGHHLQNQLMMVPHDLPLHAGIMPRLLVTIVGEPVPGGDRFQVDFIKGPDVVFHFNPRFPEQTIVRNSNLGGCWGPEEREGGFPFAPGRRFELKILVEEDMFKVAVDGTHLLEYEHRVGGLEEVTLLRVTGDVTLYSTAPSMI